MENSSCIKTLAELEFAVFCIENIAIKLNSLPEAIYKKLAIDSNILNEYIVPEYGVLHTQSKEYIINDIIELMQEKGVI
ncbi:DUF3791 domain-containing protein [Oscillospiraceae bacterium LCP21S3_A1]|jgi:hypothetical protein